MIVCDTGPLVAVLNKNDADHRRCLDLLETNPGPYWSQVQFSQKFAIFWRPGSDLRLRPDSWNL